MEYINEVKNGYKAKLKNRLFILLCEREEKGEWESLLDSILIELSGFDDLNKTIDYFSLYNKLSGAKFLSYKYFRKTIFDAMSIIDKMAV